MLGTNLVSFLEVLDIHLICLQHLARNVQSVGQWFAWKSYGTAKDWVLEGGLGLR